MSKSISEISSASTETASRLNRLFATIIDGVILMAIIVPLIIGMNLAGLGGRIFLTQILSAVIGFGVFIALNFRLLQQRGQTIGKRVMNIRIVGRDGRPMDVIDLLVKRYAPFWGVGLIPVIGGLICLANVLCIFRESQACLHDDIAQSKVIDVLPEK